MPEASPDITPTTPPSAPTPPPRAPQRDVQPRRFGLTAIMLILGALAFIVVMLALLSGNDGSSPLLENLGFGGDVRAVLYGFINVIYFIAGIIAVIALLVGGFRAATALGDQREVKRGRRTLLISLGVVLFLILSYVLIYRLIGPARDVAPPPKFTLETTPVELTGSVPFKVKYEITSSYPAEARYEWDFGDETEATGKEVSHTYQKPGVFTAELVITLNGEAVDRTERIVTVDAANPAATILVDPASASGAAPLLVTFDASASRPGIGAGKELTIAWDFGDATATESNPNTETKVRTTHRYATEGTYIVTLTVTDDQKKVGTTTKEIVVAKSKEDPIARIVTAGLQDPAAPEEPPFVSGLAPLTLSLSGASSESPNGRITEFSWSFGDGTGEGRGRSVTHAFLRPGKYLVTLTVTDELKKTASTRIEVRATPPQKAPIARIETVPPANEKSLLGNAPFTVTFSGAASTDEDGEVTAWAWDYGDGSTGDGERTEHIYGKPGTYFVKLVVTDEFDNPSKAEIYTVKVIPAEDKPLVARITTTPNPPQGVRPLLVDFDGSGSTGTSIINYRWDFGDGTPVVDTAGARESHLYETSGVYTVRLRITDVKGDFRDTTIAVSVRDSGLQAVIESDRLVASTTTPITFKGGGSIGTVARWYWDFGDGTNESGREVKHTFARQGFYTVMLIVTDASNRTDQTSVRVEIQ